ncbi:hypothetical protein BDB00DRAFT_12032 [Zychaea mexicana]|uniref:uncharacterized protein n=1 Tax=Zychaea mexicana TaxID=64656 RepID=UPI0022FF07D1|nr:uncharacterized protein BDB00DRAFT_12032 [Zychaea mexicana]KAI9499669.1 hypothetical protein BDB00DRAFT_12032 [Zychaea mexicana]
MFRLLITLGLSIALSHLANAALAPSYPEPGTVWTVGQEYDITWEDDGAKPSMKKGWKNFKIDLMTGDNMDQIFLTNVASNLSAAAGPPSFKYKAPSVEPYSPIYFFMFTNEDGENAWTTRFAIVGEDGKQEPPTNLKQPSGEKIPWGVGKLAVKAVSVDDNASSSTEPANSMLTEPAAAAAAAIPPTDDTSSTSAENSDIAVDNEIKAAAIPPQNKSAASSTSLTIPRIVFTTSLALFATFF